MSRNATSPAAVRGLLPLLLLGVITVTIVTVTRWLPRQTTQARSTTTSSEEAVDSENPPPQPVGKPVRDEPYPDIREFEAAKTRNEQRQAQRAAIMLADLEHRFSNERVAPAWASAKEAVIREANTGEQIAQLQAFPRQLSVQCKSSTCRVEADFQTRTQAEDWLTLFSLGLGSQLPQTAFNRIVAPDGSVRIVLLGQAP